MAATMLAYRMLNWQQPPQIVDVEVPTPGPGEVLVAVAGNGLCHSDLAMMQMPAAAGAWVGWNMPFTLGHEIAGHVAALGPSVRGSGVSIGPVSPGETV